MPTIVQTKAAMRKYADKYGIAKPSVIWSAPVWGTGARKLAWRVTSHARPGNPSTRKAEVDKLLFPAPLHILHPTYRWSGAPVETGHQPPYIVWHHAAGYGSPEDIHRIHLNIGDRGIAYHLYVRLDGRVYQGRPFGTYGAHCLGHNDSVGVCAEGNYQTTKEMPAAQLKAMQACHRYLHKKYPGAKDIRHKDVPSNATACPGQYYPFAKIVSA